MLGEGFFFGRQVGNRSKLSVCEKDSSVESQHRRSLTAAPLLFAYCRPSLPPRINHRLPCDISHRYHRHRPGQLNGPGSRSSSHRCHRQLTAGHLTNLPLLKCPLYMLGIFDPIAFIVSIELVIFYVSFGLRAQRTTRA